MSIVEYFKKIKNPFEKFADTQVIKRIKELGKDISTPKARTAIDPIPSNKNINSYMFQVQGGQLSLYDEHIKPITFNDNSELKL